MIHIKINKKKNQYVGFLVEGHAEYADKGQDIICSGVSVLVLNCINSIDSFTDARYHADADEITGRIEFELEKPATGDVELLLKSLFLGLRSIEESYGSKYLHVF